MDIISEKQTAELKKIISELEFLKFAIDQSAIVAMTDLKGTITYVNDTFCKVSKYSNEELLGQNHRIINSGYHSRDFFENLWKTISSGKIWKGVIKNKAKDGTFYWVDTTIVPFNDDKGKPRRYASIRHEVTELVKAKETINSEHAKLIYSEKMASLGEIAAGIAHELGNPLAAIRGRMELLQIQSQANASEPLRIQNTADTVIHLCDRMTKIIRGIRSLSRDGSNDPFSKCCIADLVEEATLISTENFAKAGITLQSDISESDKALQVECRETQTIQVLVNLLNNAKDAVQSLKEKWIKIGMTKDSESIHLSITDSGAGISKEIAHRIFEPFFTTKDVGLGTGLGLSISQAIIAAHKGRLWIDSSHPNTRFVISLPLTQAKG
jgi:PAS domain S-box-containing protein